jgi:hypothetical protein
MIINLPKIFQPFKCDDMIRVGKDHDGGYLVNSWDVGKTTHLISLGIGSDISFEQQFYQMNHCDLDAYDGTAHVNNPFFRDNKRFHATNVSSCNFESLFATQSTNIFLKCDVDGAEYEFLDILIRHSEIFSGLVMEFHDVHEYDNFNSLTNFIAKVEQKLAHVHVNNNSYLETPHGYIPMFLELTFTSSTNISWNNVKLPHKLDMSCHEQRPDFEITFV